MSQLTVSIGMQVVGHLSHDPHTNRFAFAYGSDWVAQDTAFPLCPQLPLNPRPELTPDQHSAIVRQFFENLLPEGDALDHAAQANGLSKSNLIGLMHALGRETAGAIRLSMTDRLPTEDVCLREIVRSELSQRIRQRAELPFSVWDNKVRLSIAGYQDKIAVYERSGRLFLVDGGPLASTVIIKPLPARPQLSSLPGNEFMCMLLARAVGLPVADVWLEHVPEPVLFVRRFDRRETPSGTQRLHLIDGCQALGLSVGMKYERPYGDNPDVRNIRDGANLPALFAMIDQHSMQPAMDRLGLLRWAIFQVLIGNTDAHGKNLSFFVQPSGLTLAPAYDLVCIPALKDKQLSSTLAMAIGDAFHDTDITPFEWAQLGKQAGLRPAAIAIQLSTLCKKTLDVREQVRHQTSESGVAGQDIIDIITRNCERYLRMIPDIKKIRPGDL